MPAACDVLVVGGGINGAGIARDLAGRGWSVVLAERDDLAAHTSSASTKLIHGGLRYLEHGEFRLVRKALQERETLLRSAPHLMRPLRFVIPQDPARRGARPAWQVRLGLFLYDHLARREVLPGSTSLDLRGHPAGAPLRPGLHDAFAYWDGRVDDARLVVANAIDARERGATVLTRTPCVAARRTPDGWLATLRTADGTERTLHARALVNAAGPWAASFLGDVVSRVSRAPASGGRLRLVKGSHIVIPRRVDHDDAYLFQNDDGRVLFAIPYEREFTLVGTTEVEIDPEALSAGRVAITETETAYLCAEASRWFARPVRTSEVVASFAGVRPLLEDASDGAAAVTRDWRLERDDAGAPLLTVWGGKLTTFRRLAEEAGDTVGAMLGERRPAWTATAVLPGGDLSAWTGRAARSLEPQRDFEDFRRAVAARWPWLATGLRDRWAQSYGAGMATLLAGVEGPQDLGEEVATGLHEIELQYLLEREWAQTGEDVLWRRGKLGLHLRPAESARVADWMMRRQRARAPHATAHGGHPAARPGVPEIVD
jgi:glycerol-3-phosphate dehydrogenase